MLKICNMFDRRIEIKLDRKLDNISEKNKIKKGNIVIEYNRLYIFPLNIIVLCNYRAQKCDLSRDHSENDSRMTSIFFFFTESFTRYRH